MNLSNHCRTGIFEEFEFQHVRGDNYVRIAPKNNILSFFCQSDTLPGNVNMAN